MHKVFKTRLSWDLARSGASLAGAALVLTAGVLISANRGAAQPRQSAMVVLQGVEKRYNSTNTLRSEFTQVYKAGGRTRARESGVMYIKKRGKMRWDYSDPAGKLYVSDGKASYAYFPEEKYAERTAVDESGDMRIPLAFLLGELDFQRDFGEFVARYEEDYTEIKAIPRSEKLLFTEISMRIAPDSSIQWVEITGQDFSTFEYTFSNEERNMPLNDNLFTFTPPPGTEYVDLGA